MSTTKSSSKQKKSIPPILKGFGIPVLYALLVGIIGTSIRALYVMKFLGWNFVRTLAFAIDSGSDFFPLLFKSLNFNLPEGLANGIISTVHDRLLITMVSGVLALLIVLLIVRKKKADIYPRLSFENGTKKATACAIMIGLGIGGLMIGFDSLRSIFKSYIIEIAKDIITPYFDSLVKDFEYLLDYNGKWHGGMLDTFIAHILRAFFLDAWDYSRFFSVTIINAVLHAITCALIFGLGMTGNLKKKMPAFLVVLLSAVLYAFLGSTQSSLIFALVIGAFLGWIYLKSDSLITAFVFSLSTGFFSILGMAGKMLFGSYYIFNNIDELWGWKNITQTPDLYSPFQLSVKENIYEVCSIVYLVVAALVAIPLLVIGIIMLARLKPKAPEPCTSEQDLLGDAADDPFAST